MEHTFYTLAPIHMPRNMVLTLGKAKKGKMERQVVIIMILVLRGFRYLMIIIYNFFKKKKKTCSPVHPDD